MRIPWMLCLTLPNTVFAKVSTVTIHFRPKVLTNAFLVPIRMYTPKIGPTIVQLQDVQDQKVAKVSRGMMR